MKAKLIIPAAYFAEDGSSLFEVDGKYQELADGERVDDELRFWSYVIKQLKEKEIHAEIAIENNLDPHYRGIEQNVMDDIYDNVPDDRSRIQMDYDIVSEFSRFFGVNYCLRCRDFWYSRVRNPLRCPRCGNKNWKTERKEIEPGRKPKERV